MSIVKKKPYLDPVLKAQFRAGGQEIKQKDRHDDVFKIYSCLKEFETANDETLNPEMKFSIQSKPSIQPDTNFPATNLADTDLADTDLPATNLLDTDLPITHLIPSNLRSLSEKICRVEESGSYTQQPAERSHLNFSRPTESPSVVTGRAAAIFSCPIACPEAPEARN